MIDKLIFDMKDPDDVIERQHMLKAMDYYLTLYDIAVALRNSEKYGSAPKTIAEFRDLFWEICKERGVDPYAN